MNQMEVMEKEITQLLQSYANDSFARYELAPLVAKRSLMMHHLYEDLGFNNRIEMGRFMTANFPLLAKQKPTDKLWKKYIYDLIGKVAPACVSCTDNMNCFACKVA